MMRVSASLALVLAALVVNAYLIPSTATVMPALNAGSIAIWVGALFAANLLFLGAGQSIFAKAKIKLKGDRLRVRMGFRSKDLLLTDIQRIVWIIDERSQRDGHWLWVVGRDFYFEFKGMVDQGVGETLDDLGEILQFDWTEASREMRQHLEPVPPTPWRKTIYRSDGSAIIGAGRTPDHARRLRRHAFWTRNILSWAPFVHGFIGMMTIVPAISVLLDLFGITGALGDIAVGALFMASLFVPLMFQTFILAGQSKTYRVALAAYTAYWLLMLAAIGWVLELEVGSIAALSLIGAGIALILSIAVRTGLHALYRREDALVRRYREACGSTIHDQAHP
jgi:hypothetical protein